MENQVELLVGLSLLITGLSILFNPRDWIHFINHIKQRGNWAIMIAGIADLLFGALIISFHWVWSGLPIITSAIGLALFLRGSIRLIFPKWVLGILSHEKVFLISGAIFALILAYFVLYGWYLASNFYGVNFYELYSN